MSDRSNTTVATLTKLSSMKQIENLEDLWLARFEKKALVTPHWHLFSKPKPAAFYMNLSGEILLRMFHNGVFIYEKQKSK